MSHLIYESSLSLCYAQMGVRLWRSDRTGIALLVPQAALVKSRREKKKIVKVIFYSTSKYYCITEKIPKEPK